MLDLSTYYSLNCPEKEFKDIYNAYEEELRKNRLIDFDDMVIKCYELLKNRQDILLKWQEKYKYILVDEFQDINRMQYEVVKLLAKPEDNLFVVGDDDQSIYTFRGAKPEIMLNFEKDFGNAKRILLNYNYRSQKEIVEASLKLISHNKLRFDKKLLAVREGSFPVEKVTFPTDEEQNERIVDDIRRHIADGKKPGDLAVLYRTNTAGRDLMGKLMNYCIPFWMRDIIPCVFDHWIAKDIFAYMDAAAGNRSGKVIRRIINRPTRYISNSSVSADEISFEELKEEYSDKNWAIRNIEQLESDLRLIAKSNPYAAITYIRRGVGYDEYLKQYADYRRINVDDLYETLTELQESAKEFSTRVEWYDYIENYRSRLEEQKKERSRREVNGVVLSTIHSSKGLEYDTVIIPDANDGELPYKKAITTEDIEEERRLFYVAMTRAKNKLFIYSSKLRHGRSRDISPFVMETGLSEEDYKVGKRLRHKTYGEGTIEENKDGKLAVRFDKTNTVRNLDLRTCIKNGLFI